MDSGTLRVLLLELARNSGIDLSPNIAISGPVASRPYSLIYRVEAPNSPTLAAKLCANRVSLTPDRKFAGRQYDALSRSYEAMKDIAMFRVPKPVALFAEQAIILMEWVGGQPLVEVLRHRCIATERTVEGAKLAGMWLRHFHQAGFISSTMFEESNLLDYVSKVRTDLSAQGVKGSAITYALATLENLVPTLVTCSFKSSWLHGDFQPSNIILAQDAVFGLDVGHSAKGPGLADAAHFLNYIGRLAFLPKGVHLLRVRNKIMSAFIAGYLDQKGADYLPLYWFLVLDDLQFLARHYRRTRTLLHRWYFVKVEQLTLAESLKILTLVASRQGSRH